MDISMGLSLELTYLVKIENWPWNNDSNILRFCFDLHSTHNIYDNDVYVSSPNEVISDVIDDNSLHICHIVYNHFVEVTHSGYVFHTKPNLHKHKSEHFESRMNDIDDINAILSNTTDDEYELLISTVNINAINIDIDDDTSNHNVTKFDFNYKHLPWLFGVFIAILFVICIFVSLIIYLTKEGFFDDDQSQFIKNKKRKKSTMIIMDNRKCFSAQSNTCTSMANSTQSAVSPKKNIRINVTYHSPKEIPNTHCDYNNDTNHDDDDDNNTNDHKTRILINDIEISKTRSITKRKSITCESTKIIHQLSVDREGSALIAIHEDIEAEAEDEDEDGDHRHHRTTTPINSMGTPTITINSNDDSESGFEESMIQYVLTMSNENEKTPVPFI